MDANLEELKEKIKRRMNTIMIGALASIENALDIDNSDSRTRELFSELRKEILDKGNIEIRNTDNDFKNFVLFSAKVTKENGRNKIILPIRNKN